MKQQIRVYGIDDAPFNRFKDKKTMVVATFFRGGDFIDGVLSSNITLDGSDSTSKLVKMINDSKFRNLSAIFLNGIAFGGFNVVDINRLYNETKIPVIVVIRSTPNYDKIERALKNLKEGNKKWNLIKKAGVVHKTNGIYVQLAGLSLDRAREILTITCRRSKIPEPLRVAHIIAGGVKDGQSRGGA